MAQKKQRTTKKSWWQRLNARRQAFLARRPHRSFRVTRRRDYRRSLKVPGYIALTRQTIQLLWRHRRLFIKLSLVYALAVFLLAGVMSQETYEQLRNAVSELDAEHSLGSVMSVLTLFAGVASNQLVGGATPGATNVSQQVLGALVGLYIWLTAIWLLRAVFGKKKVLVRDGLYRAGAPVIALAVLFAVILMQLLPAAIAVVAYGAADASGVLKQTVILMLAGGATILIVALSLYWMTSTIFAMAIATLPGMYPFEALRLASDIVLGRRIRILLRLVWLIGLLALVWVVVLVPVIVLDGLIKGALPIVQWLPLVPLTALFLATSSLIFAASYTYLFYRKVVDDDSAPA